MNIFQNIDKNNLHHAYLIEGDREFLLPEILAFIESLGVKTSANADFSYMSFDSLKMEDARALKALSFEKSNSTSKRVFLIYVNTFLIEAQNTLLKMFEEPIKNTHFFLVVPDKNSLLKTLFSRFYFISTKIEQKEEIKKAEDFIKLSLNARIDLIKDLLSSSKEEDEEGNEIVVLNSTRFKALNFLNALEFTLHKNLLKYPFIFEHIFKVRKFLRMPGSSAKSLMESVAILIPNL